MKEKSEKRVLVENFIAVSLTQIITYVFPLILLPYVSRVLGAEKFGLVYWAQSIIAYFIVLTEFGFNISAVRDISTNRDNKEKINQIFSSILFVKFILIIISLIIFSVLIFVIPKFNNEWMLFYITFIGVIGNAIYPIWYFQGIEHMKYITFLNILARTISLLAIFIFVHKPEDYLLIAFLYSLGNVVAGIIGITLAWQRFGLRIVLPKLSEIKYQIKYSSEFFLSRIAVTGYTNTNSFVIGLISNPIMVAYYVAAEKIYYAMNNLSAPIGNVLYPYMAKQKNIKKYKRIFYPALIFSIFMVLFMIIFAKYFITIFYGIEMQEAYKVLRILCIGGLFAFPSALIGYPLLAAMGHSKIPNFSVVCSCVFQITGLILLVKFNYHNIYNVAWMMVGAEFVSLVYRVWGIKKYKLWRENLND